MLAFLEKNIVHILYLIGLIIIYFHQKSKIGNLKGDFDRAIDLLTVYDPEKIKVYSKLGEEQARFEYEKKEFVDYKALLKTRLDQVVQLLRASKAKTGLIKQGIENLKKEEEVLRGLLIDIFYPLSQTEYLEQVISKLPEGITKDAAQFVRSELKERNKEKGITDPLMDLARDESARRLPEGKK